jgi:hypothetical protein
MVSVILDGENCWEHYPGGGVTFLRALYDRCTRANDIRPVQIGAFLDQYPPRDTLPHLFAGSWISHNFAIWIGHEEDNTAWDALHRAREHLKQRSTEFGLNNAETGPESRNGEPWSRHTGLADNIHRAWEEIYIAEGSDWFWWYGDDHSSDQDALFDYLFRKHLQNVYVLLGDTPPTDLARPISRRAHRAIYSQPRAFLDVKIDGRQTFFEWISAGRYTCQNERGTMTMVARGPLKDVYFGFNLHALLIRVDFDNAARATLADFDMMRFGFVEPPGWELVIEAPATSEQTIKLVHQKQDMPATGVAVAIDNIVEAALPFEHLGLKVDDPIQFFVELLEGQQSRERAPREGTINLTCPSPNFEQEMWDV